MKNYYYLTEKSKQLQLNVDDDITETLIQLQDTPTKYFAASKIENYVNEILVFKRPEE